MCVVERQTEIIVQLVCERGSVCKRKCMCVRVRVRVFVKRTGKHTTKIVVWSLSEYSRELRVREMEYNLVVDVVQLHRKLRVV
jgi:hypothetical protein